MGKELCASAGPCPCALVVPHKCSPFTHCLNFSLESQRSGQDNVTHWWSWGRGPGGPRGSPLSDTDGYMVLSLEGADGGGSSAGNGSGVAPAAPAGGSRSSSRSLGSSGGEKEEGKKVRRQWESWSTEDKNTFFEGLYEVSGSCSPRRRLKLLASYPLPVGPQAQALTSDLGPLPPHCDFQSCY